MTVTSTSRWARITLRRATGWASSNSIVPRSISPAMAPAARPIAQMHTIACTSGCVATRPACLAGR